MPDPLDWGFDPAKVGIRLHETSGMSNPETQASVHVDWGLDQPRDEGFEDQLEVLIPVPGDFDTGGTARLNVCHLGPLPRIAR